MLTYLIRPIQSSQTYLNLLYTFVACILGIFYFPFVLLALVLAMTAPIIIVIIPLAAGVLACCWYFAAFERILVMSWLHIDIAPMSKPRQPHDRWYQRLLGQISNSVLWKSLAYLLLKFPFAVTVFCLSAGLLPSGIAVGLVFLLIMLVFLPFFYLCALIFYGRRAGASLSQYIRLSLIIGTIISCSWLYVLNFLTQWWARFGQTMLGMGDQARRLTEATLIAEQERAKALRAEQSRNELIINVSHELRTPVASIRGHIESLLISCDEEATAAPSPEVLRNYLNIVHRESLRLGSLVNDLLSLARAEASELRLNMEPVAAGNVVEEVYQTLMPLARRERQIVLIRSVVPVLPRVMADRQRLTQVLLNLVRNAITYTPDGGIVSITLRQISQDQLELAVADTGIGISPEDQKRIFDRFYRTDASRTRSSGGFGLGLSIVYDFVTAMGGSISVESREGEGSCFRVILQIAQISQLYPQPATQPLRRPSVPRTY